MKTISKIGLRTICTCTLLTLMLALPAGCVTTNRKQEEQSNADTKTQPQDEIISYRYIPIEPLPMPAKAVPGTQGSDDAASNEEILKSLHNEAFMMYISDSDIHGSASMVVSLQGGRQKGQYTLDQIKYRVCPYTVKTADEKEHVVFLIVGIGGRATIQYEARNAIANSGGIFGLAAQLSANKAQGSIDIRSMGISGKSIAPFMGSPGEITMNNITDSLKKIDAIKLVGILSASDPSLTILHPQILAVDPQDLTMKDVMSSLYRSIDKAAKKNRLLAAQAAEANPTRSPSETPDQPGTGANPDGRPDVDVETLDYMLY
jgi:hypothetical protein